MYNSFIANATSNSKGCRQEKIRLNENLNIPGQHELLARLMCDRISASLLEEFTPKFASHLAILNEGQVVDGLGSLMRDWGLDILGKSDFTSCQACFTDISNNHIQDAMNKLQDPMFNLSTWKSEDCYFFLFRTKFPSCLQHSSETCASRSSPVLRTFYVTQCPRGTLIMPPPFQTQGLVTKEISSQWQKPPQLVSMA